MIFEILCRPNFPPKHLTALMARRSPVPCLYSPTSLSRRNDLHLYDAALGNLDQRLASISRVTLDRQAA